MLKNKLQARVLRFLLIIVLSFFAFFVFFFITIFSFRLAYLQKIYPGISIADVDVGGKTQKQALELLNPLLAKFANQPLTFIYENKQFALFPQEIKLFFLKDSSVQKAFNWQRTPTINPGLLQFLFKAGVQVNLGLEYEIDHLLFENNLASIAARIEIPSIPPSIKIERSPIDQIMVDKGKPGVEINKAELRELLETKIASAKTDPILIPTKTINPSITEDQLGNAQKRAQQLLGKSITLSLQENSWQLKDEEMVNFISFVLDFDEEKIASWTAQLAEATDKPAENALFSFENGKVTEFRAANLGVRLNQTKTIELLKTTILGLEKEENKEAKISLPFSSLEPKIKTEEVNQLGIKELVSEGVSYFYGSITSRVHNISLASNRLNGLLIEPNQTFSLNQALGEISNLTGYQQAYIIKDGKTILGDGGGVCQVSTTLFRAALNAGLTIAERHPHAYRVSYYEQNSPVGLDASIFQPTADLKFINNTPAYLLIQTKVDKTNKKLTFLFYGSKDNRQIAVSQSRLWDQVAPPPDLYQDDPGLANGVIKQVDWKAWGAKASFDYKVVKEDQVLQEITFYSNYRPWQAVFLRGTGGQ